MTTRYAPGNCYYFGEEGSVADEAPVGGFVRYSDYAELVSATKRAIRLLEDGCRWGTQDELEEVLEKLGEEV